MLSEPMAKHEIGKITSAWHGREDHGILTCSIGIDFDAYGHQAFGGVALNDRTGPLFIKELLGTFGVQKLDELVGRRCVAYWKYGRHNEYIEALGDPVTGRILQINEWRQRMHPGTPSLDEQKRERLMHEAELADQRAREIREELESLKEKTS